MEPRIRTVIIPPTASVFLDHPPLNILDLPMIEELEHVVRDASRRTDLSLFVFDSAVRGAFSAGVDVKDHVPWRVKRMLGAFHAVFRCLHSLDVFTVAAVDGHCLGGGCELATACDIVLATKRSRFGQPEIDVGCFPPVAASLLARRVGRGRAASLMLTGRAMTAKESKEAGLVDQVLSGRAALVRELEGLIDSVTSKSAPVVRAMKRAFRKGLELPFLGSLTAAEEIYLRDLLPLEDLQEGVDAFLEKRAPAWKNR